MDASFSNIGTSGYQRYVEVTSSTGPYHHNEYCSLASSHIPRFFRVRAQNDQGVGDVTASSPLSATPALLPPGQPQSVLALPSSGTGIFVSWDEPDADLSVFGGDGGSSITKYVIEWDVSPYFDTPASHAELLMPASHSYLIGGNNVFTGVHEPVLLPGVAYYVRVYAVHNIGAGPVCNANNCVDVSYLNGVTPSDQVPQAPNLSRLMTVAGQSGNLMANWEMPEIDGGLPLTAFRVEYDSSTSFSSGVGGMLTVPVVHEMQSVAVSRQVVNKEQRVQATVEVTNERQTIRTSCTNCQDEIQTIQIDGDILTNKIQTITLAATDYDEIQTVTVDADSSPNEFQVLRTNGQQKLETQTIKLVVDRVPEVQTLTFNFPGSGTQVADGYNSDSDSDGYKSGTFQLSLTLTAANCEFCQSADSDGNTVILASYLTVSSGAIDPFAGKSGWDGDGTDDTDAVVQGELDIMCGALGMAQDCITVETDIPNDNDMVLVFTFEKFPGDVPTLDIDNCLRCADHGNASPYDNEATKGILVTTEGAQPSGHFVLEYTCEEYSDPSLDSYTSSLCAASSQESTTAIDMFEQAIDMADKLSAIDIVGTVTATRTQIADNSEVDYVWTVTFGINNGNIPELDCDEANLGNTLSTGTGLSCDVATTRDGSILGGTFVLKDGLDTNLVTAPIDWDADAATVESIIEAVAVFGDVDVSRTFYQDENDSKWSGGFSWTVTFLDRVGNVPNMVPDGSSLTHSIGGASIEIEIVDVTGV